KFRVSLEMHQGLNSNSLAAHLAIGTEKRFSPWVDLLLLQPVRSQFLVNGWLFCVLKIPERGKRTQPTPSFLQLFSPRQLPHCSASRHPPQPPSIPQTSHPEFPACSGFFP